MRSFPDPAILYPEVAAAGSLAAALQAVAAEHGLVLSEVRAHQKQPLQYASVRSSTPLRDALGVSAGADRRIWSISGWGQGIFLVSGATQELSEIARASQGWQDGTTLRDIQRSAPFVELEYLAEAAERGPEHVVAAQWQWLRDDAQQQDWPEYRALIEAAYAEPKLRQLYPYTSHWTLRFSTTTGFRFSPDVVCLQAVYGDRGYRVKADYHQAAVLGEAVTAEMAVSLAVGHLSAGLGPAVAGAYQGEAHADGSVGDSG